jgi:hypothetical protein
VGTLEDVASALGARLVGRLEWQGEGLERLLDEGHSRLVDRVVSELAAAGWTCLTEVSFSVFGERGSVDILAFHATSRVLLVVEIKTVIPEVGGMLMTLDRKARLAPQIAQSRDWPIRSVARLLVVRDSRTARRRVDELATTFINALPNRGWRVRAWLRNPTTDGPAFAGLWLLSDDRAAVVSRRHRVRRPRSEHGT